MKLRTIERRNKLDMRRYIMLAPTLCPECGKTFVPAMLHVYHNELDDLVCTYTCMLKSQRRVEQEILKKEERRKQINSERSAVIKEAKKYGFKNSRGHITAKVAREAKLYLDEIKRRGEASE